MINRTAIWSGYWLATAGHTGVGLSAALLFLVSSLTVNPVAAAGNGGVQSRVANIVAKTDSTEPTRSLRWYLQSAQQGLAASQYQVGLMYERGSGVERSWEQALHWYQLAAVQDYPPAQFALGELYRFGDGSDEGEKIDRVLAYVWYYLSARNGYESAVAARDLMIRVLDPDQLSQSNWQVRQISEEIDRNRQKEIVEKRTLH